MIATHGRRTRRQTARLSELSRSDLVLWPLDVIAVMQQFVRNWEQTGLVINHLDTSLLTLTGHRPHEFVVTHNTGYP